MNNRLSTKVELSRFLTCQGRDKNHRESRGTFVKTPSKYTMVKMGISMSPTVSLVVLNRLVFSIRSKSFQREVF